MVRNVHAGMPLKKEREGGGGCNSPLFSRYLKFANRKLQRRSVRVYSVAAKNEPAN